MGTNGAVTSFYYHLLLCVFEICYLGACCFFRKPKILQLKMITMCHSNDSHDRFYPLVLEKPIILEYAMNKLFKYFPKRTQILFLTDFDSTITQYDTCTKIPILNPKHKHAWNRLSNHFIKTYHTKFYSTLKTLKPVNTKEEAIKAASEVLTIMDSVEEMGVNETERQSLLSGIPKSDLENLGKQAKLNSYVGSTMQYLLKACLVKSELHVISSNWSFDVVSSAIKQLSVPYVKSLDGTILDGHVNIFCNDLEFDKATGLTTGKIIRKTVTHVQKRQYISKLNRSESVVIFVGDAVPDLVNLLEADVGIIFGLNKELGILCSVLGIQVKKIREFKKSFNSETPVLYRTFSWKAIMDFVLSEV